MPNSVGFGGGNATAGDHPIAETRLGLDRIPHGFSAIWCALELRRCVEPGNMFGRRIQEDMTLRPSFSYFSDTTGTPGPAWAGHKPRGPMGLRTCVKY